MAVVYKNITLLVNVEIDEVIAEVYCELEFDDEDNDFDYDIIRITAPPESTHLYTIVGAETFQSVFIAEYLTRRFSDGLDAVNDGDVIHLTLPTPKLLHRV